MVGFEGVIEPAVGPGVTETVPDGEEVTWPPKESVRTISKVYIPVPCAKSVTGHDIELLETVHVAIDEL